MNPRANRILTSHSHRKHVSTAEQKWNEGRTTADSLLSSRPCTSTQESIHNQIKSKYRTFVQWNAESYFQEQNNLRKSQKNDKTDFNANIFSALLSFTNELKKKEERSKKRKKHSQSSDNFEAVLLERRERFKKLKNPLEFISYYIKKKVFDPTPSQQKIIEKTVELKALMESMPTFNLQKTLSEIYVLMNITVDYNELKFFILVILMAAEVCYQARDFKRSFYYYNQAKIAAEYTECLEFKIQALMGMAKISFECSLCPASIIFLKKALGYSWKLKDRENQLNIYELLGENYCLEGKMSQAKYYHERYAQNQLQKDTSAIKKIYLQIIKEDNKSKNLQLYSENIDLLLIETLCLPIVNFEQIKPRDQNWVFDNYVEGCSPRKKLVNKSFEYLDFATVEKQIAEVLEKDSEFEKEMPDPNIQLSYSPVHRYGKERREIEFSRTMEFHKITGNKTHSSEPTAKKRYSLEKQIEIQMSEKPDPRWYEKMVANIKQERAQKLGSLRDRVRKSHLKVREKKRALSSQSDNIKCSINKAMIDWIDPIK